ncbi:MAG: bifunctional diaminohydroxyphosphoribosylaminopyrimidine deaminase/5-amino-6-(5-phosphoribosylamino)uracil reductase RibD [Micropepsaceae bacterium]
MPLSNDARFMQLALRLAQRGLGRVWPNPSVGCVIVDVRGHVVARGWTQNGGRPHAETEALARAGVNARGATAYVTLEPCAHQGQTGPCAEALIKAGLVRVVSATVDPDPRVAGRGHDMLAAAGVHLRTGVLQDAARELNAGFFSRVQRARPHITLKVATTLDGKIALSGGESKWITGTAARAHAHLVRSQHDAIMVGSGTALADDPELSCRLPGGDHPGLVRIVLDTTAKLPTTSKLVLSAARQPVWLLTSDHAATRELEERKVKVFRLPTGPDGIDIQSCLKLLASQGLTRVLVEGGARLASTLVKSGVVDQLLWYRSPAVMGEGKSVISGFDCASIAEMPRFIRKETTRLGEDVLETYRVAT